MKGEKKVFYTTTQEGTISFIAQRCSNARGQYMALVEDGNGGERNFIFIPEVMDGLGWRKMACALREGGHNRGWSFFGADGGGESFEIMFV